MHSEKNKKKFDPFDSLSHILKAILRLIPISQPKI